MNVLWSTTAPATLPSGETPGCRVTKVAASRPMDGRFSKSSPQTVLPTVAFKVCSAAPFVTVTSTVSATEPISRVMLSVSEAPMFTIWSTSLETRKPVLFTVTVYLLGTAFAKKYPPVSFVVSVRAIFVAVSVKVTAAPTTAPPDGSVTVPATVPVDALWANRDDGETANKQNNAARSKATRLLDIQLPPGWAFGALNISSS